MSRRGDRLKSKRAAADSAGSRNRRGSRLTVLGIEQALAELGICARLSDIVARPRSIENGGSLSRRPRNSEQMC